MKTKLIYTSMYNNICHRLVICNVQRIRNRCHGESLSVHSVTVVFCIKTAEPILSELVSVALEGKVRHTT